ncbi:class F sortase [Cohnella thailandensis]|uniref:Sortase n=1 Tax=Cohnella thailandensis TaxID=557557 RepID=A0A841SUP7_9BACL|nr:class F sortase [Cohnella thailandensis]MBB6633928.1 sortase [Cohnella thailandensis]MBP1972611.1 LPXTG-site transpeptidase (sortase) family protein [Cohnella thailandensis]
MKSFILFFALIAASLTVTGCGSDSTGPAEERKETSESLQKVDSAKPETTRQETRSPETTESPAPSATGESPGPLQLEEGSSKGAPKPLEGKTARLYFTPNRLLIPSVRIDAPVDPVGVSDNGQMEVPESTVRAGILSPGVKPGLPGTALMAGHVDNYTGPAIFYPLKKLKPGDPILLTNGKGQYLVYKVTSVESFKTAEAPLDRIFGHTEESRLNLITCTGKYDRKRKEHEKRLVVFSRLMQ